MAAGAEARHEPQQQQLTQLDSSSRAHVMETFTSAKETGRRGLYLHRRRRSPTPAERSPVGKRRYTRQVGGDRDGCKHSCKDLGLGEKVSNTVRYC